MRKLCLFECLLVMMFLIACGKDEDPALPLPSGRFVHEGISYDLHSATRHGYYGVINSMCLRFSSADGNTVVDVSVITEWEGPGMERSDVELTSGIYGMMEYSVLQDGDRIRARLSLTEVPLNPDWEVECTSKGNGMYDLRIYDPEFPDTRYIVWNGKIVWSNVLL